MKGAQVEMQNRWSQQVVGEEDPASEADTEGLFCPECGQSLDLARHRELPAKRRTLEPFVFLIFGLCLTVAFGMRAWQTHVGMVGLGQEMASWRVEQRTVGTFPKPGNPSMIVADMTSEVSTEQLDLELVFRRDITGLGLGLLALIVGAVSWLHARPEVVDGPRKLTRPQGLPSSHHPHVGGGPLDLGSIVAITMVRMTLLLFVIIVGAQVIRGVPPSVQLVDQALTRIVALIVAIVLEMS